MIDILIAVAIALTVSILLTPMLIRLFTRQGFGHEIREDGPPSHKTKRGTPSMGGVAILAGIWAGYLGTHLAGLAFNGEGPSASGLLVLFLATTLGAVGFVDDLIKIRRSRNLGLNKTAKTVGQITAAVLVGVLVLQFRNDAGLTPGTSDLSYVREIATVTLAPALFVLFCVVVISAWSNAVNFTDGLDGLAAGSMAMVTALRADHILAVPQRLRGHAGSGLLQRARSAGPGDHRRRDGGRLHRVSVVERSAGQNFHGRHRIAGPGWRHRRDLGDQPH